MDSARKIRGRAALTCTDLLHRLRTRDFGETRSAFLGIWTQGSLPGVASHCRRRKKRR